MNHKLPRRFQRLVDQLASIAGDEMADAWAHILASAIEYGRNMPRIPAQRYQHASHHCGYMRPPT